MYRRYSQDLLSATTPAEVLAVARDVLADLTPYHRAECEGVAATLTPRQRARTQSRAFNAAGEMHLVLQHYFSSEATSSGGELDYFTVLLACVLSSDVNNDKTSGAAQWATGKLWAQGSASLGRYLAALALAAHDPPADVPRTLLQAAAVVSAVSEALTGADVFTPASELAPIGLVSTEPVRERHAA